MATIFKSSISPLVYFLTVCFGISAWIEASGVYTQVPLMIYELPEYWNLLSYLILFYAVGNIGLVVYAVYHRLAKNPRESLVIGITIILGALVCLFGALFWRRTTVIAGVPRSLALYILAASLSFVDCVSSVVYLTYMGAFKSQYFSGYFVGEGLSGLIPSIVSLIQGAASDPVCRNVSSVEEVAGKNVTTYSLIPTYDPPRISVEAVIYLLMGMMCISGIAFALLDLVPTFKSERMASKSSDGHKKGTNEENRIENTISYVNVAADLSDVTSEYSKHHSTPDADISKDATETKDAEAFKAKIAAEQKETELQVEIRNNKGSDGADMTKLSPLKHGLVHFLVAWSNFWVIGMLPSYLPYACLPYGNLAFSLALRLGLVSAPVVSLLSLFVVITSLTVLSSFILVGTVLSCFLLYLAKMSPSPPLQFEVGGQAMVIISNVAISALVNYARCCFAIIAQKSGHKHSLLYMGIASQIGSLTGVILSFVLVNRVELFINIPPCEMPGARFEN